MFMINCLTKQYTIVNWQIPESVRNKAVVVGGTSMSGGSGKLGGTLIGVLIIGILNNGLNLMGVNSDWQYIIKGAVILLAVYTDFLRNRKKAG